MGSEETKKEILEWERRNGRTKKEWKPRRGNKNREPKSRNQGRVIKYGEPRGGN